MSQKTIRRVLEIESQAISNLISRVDDASERAVELMAECKGRVVVSGLGKSGIVGRKIAATLSSTGTPALFLHPAEAIHGDLGMLAPEDVVLALSNSGETDELVQLLQTIKRLGTPLICMVGNPKSTLGRSSDVMLNVGVDQEACPFGMAPTASTTAALALGDALAMALSEKKGFRLEDFARLHPGGRLGKKLSRVEDLMHVGNKIPKVSTDTAMEAVIYEMSQKGLGVTTVVEEEDHLVGVVSDGDLRRMLQTEREVVLSRTAVQCMTKNPVTIRPGELSARALHLMEQSKITSLMVTDESGKLVGIIHVHDLWGTEMF